MDALTRMERHGSSGFAAESEGTAASGEIERLFTALDRVTCADHPRTARLLSSGRRKKSQKVVEEAAELALETVRKHTDAAIRESADLVYHLVVLWHECGITPAQIWAEMQRRADAIGIAEKLPKAPGRTASRPSTDSATASKRGRR
jgi:phosphoribosyl-ATP pyrophosphohydrolase